MRVPTRMVGIWPRRAASYALLNEIPSSFGDCERQCRVRVFFISVFRRRVKVPVQCEIRHRWRRIVAVDVYTSEGVGTGSKWSHHANALFQNYAPFVSGAHFERDNVRTRSVEELEEVWVKLSDRWRA